uniref:DNA repair protein XRCC3 isoform X1 n=2 Tax=Geotrypetes seraphini TaxID=260995 RepID=A0A6P8RRR4_GEOSA|nr:DNA repair protein XRCC3 isoform X1 [Geotrypetes seraphini]XP_033808134.1 DNA repair protein XRCC3 isoform X1 [Geotrypetes seraphini]
MDWDQLDLNPRVLTAVKKAKIKSMSEVLKYSGPDLQRLTKLSIVDVQHLLKAVSAELRKNSVVTAFQMYHEKHLFTVQHQKLSLGCPILDSFLRGGIPLVGITELAGESSAGKTQICLQLCLSVQYPGTHGGLEAGAVYICTEDVFPNKRLQQLIGQQHKLRADVPLDVIKKIKFGDNIFIEHAADIDTLNDCITKRVPILLLRGSVRLIIIDSIAALFRGEFAAKDSAVRAKYMQTFGAKLQNLSSRFQTPVLCINQVTDAVGDIDAKQSNFGLLDKKVAPALGITWSNQLLMRLMVTRTHYAEAEPEQHPAVPSPQYRNVLRIMEVIFAPHLPQYLCYYVINLEGVKGRKDKE